MIGGAMDTLNSLIFGMIAMACLVASLAFLRFWRLSRDRFFLLFAVSFGLQAAVRVGLGLIPVDTEGRTLLYWLRLLAYLLILFAILDKNRPKPAVPGEDTY